MATEKRRMMVEQEVEICDGCGSHVQPIERVAICLGDDIEPLREGRYCTICINRIINSPNKRKRKPKAVVENPSENT